MLNINDYLMLIENLPDEYLEGVYYVLNSKVIGLCFYFCFGFGFLHLRGLNRLTKCLALLVQHIHSSKSQTGRPVLKWDRGA